MIGSSRLNRFLTAALPSSSLAVTATFTQRLMALGP